MVFKCPVCAHQISNISRHLGTGQKRKQVADQKGLSQTLANHPDKVAESDRASAEIKFKAISQAYEILQDDDKRHLYDTHGMSAFEKGGNGGMGTGVDLDDVLAQMFGMSGGVPPGFGGGARPGLRKPQKGDNEEQNYQVTLEELYKGKTVKFASKKNIICSHCKGTGGKDKAKPKQCGSCQGRGFKQALRSVGPGLVTQETVECSACNGSGSVYKDKDKCKKCKGKRVTEERKALEIYIPRGSREGDRVVLEGEADQVPGQEPGDIVFNIVEVEHQQFRHTGADLSADLDITLAEALCGFSRVVIKHLDGRGIQITHQRPDHGVLRPGQVIKVEGEGMPYKKSDLKGDLYLVVKVQFPEDDWLKDETTASELGKLLPKPAPPISADTIDEVEYDEKARIEDFGANDDGGGGGAWEDEDEGQEAGCAQQ